MFNIEQLVAGTGHAFTNEIMQAALAEANKEKALKLGKVCVKLMEQFDSSLSANVSVLRNYRKQAKRQETLVKNFSRAVDYFKVTGNPLPVFAAYMPSIDEAKYAAKQALGNAVDFDDVPAEAWKVPEDWAPAVEKAAVSTI